MNIFYLHHDPKTCASYHCDKHVVKMITEYAQLLSTAHHLLDPYNPRNHGMYKLTHEHHPSTKWVIKSSDNYLFLHSLYCELHKVYQERYGAHKTHKAFQIEPLLRYIPFNIDVHEGFFSPPNVMPDECIISIDTRINYKHLYLTEKLHMVTYKTGEPDWFKFKDWNMT